MTMDRSAFDLRALLSSAQLPALPQSAIRLLQLSQDTDNGPAEFAIPIETDPGLASQVLRFVNSSYFGFSEEITSVKLGIALVGIRTIKNFTLWSAVFSLMPNPKCGPFNLKVLWQDSLRRALLARLLGHCLGQSDAEELFAAALLQDMALPLLAKELPVEYGKLLKTRRGGRTRLSDLEHERFGWTHAEAAGLMAQSWRLSGTFKTLLENHIHFDKLVNGNPKPGQIAVGLSAMLPSAQDADWFDRAQFVDAFSRLTGQSVDDLPALFEQVDQGYGQFAPMLKLGIPDQSLVTWLQPESTPL